MAEYNSDRTGANIDATLDKVDVRDAVIDIGGNTTNRVTVASNGNVGVNVSDPIYKLEVQGEAGIELYNNTGGGDVLNFRPSLGDANKYNMSISSYDHSGGGVGPADGLSINGNDGVSICTGSTASRQERVRVDLSGNFLVGTASEGGWGTQDGFIARRSGITTASATNIWAFSANRKGNDGSIVEFRKDGDVVGSIGASGGQLKVTSESNLVLENDSRILSFGSTTLAGAGSGNDAVIDLGTYNRRFKDLYLSGGVYLGGTGSANKLDDYEEGTFSPTMAASGATVTYSEQFGRYVKIGDLVHIQARVTIDTVGGSGSLKFGSLPFTADSGQYYNSSFSITRVANFNTDLSTKLQGIMVIQGQDFGYLYYSNNLTGNTSTMVLGDVKAGSTIVFSGAYKVN